MATALLWLTPTTAAIITISAVAAAATIPKVCCSNITNPFGKMAMLMANKRATVIKYENMSTVVAVTIRLDVTEMTFYLKQRKKKTQHIICYNFRVAIRILRTTITNNPFVGKSKEKWKKVP